MFLDLIKGEDKKIFLEIAKRIARADGLIHDSEQTFLEHYAERLNLDSLDTSDYSNMSLFELVNNIKDEQTERAVFVEIMSLAFADEVYHDEQKTMIHEVKETFNFSSDYYYQVKNWIIELNNLYKKGMELLSS